MKKTIIMLSAIALLASCGGRNMDADAKEICDCFKDTKNKTTDCVAKFDKMKESYTKEEQKKLWEKATLECGKE